MQFKLFSIPATGDAEAEEELNRFLRSHRAVSVQKELVQGGHTAYWCFCVEYLPSSPAGRQRRRRRPRVDYKELLSADDFAVFVRLREARKQLAGKEAIPVYAVCTNEQLAEMAKGRAATLADLKKIDGFGDAKAEKYGETFLAAIREADGAARMKRAGNLIERIADADNLRLAFWKASKGKRAKAEVLAFRADLDAQLRRLGEELLGRFGPLGAVPHVHGLRSERANDLRRPLPRPRGASRDHERRRAALRVVPDPRQLRLPHRQGAGRGDCAGGAASRRPGDWYLKMDVRKYFDSIDHGVLKGMLRRRFKDPLLLALLDGVIDSYATSPGRGLPIGNLTSQFFANHYLGVLDHHVKQTLGCRRYVRYMDDFVVWDSEKDRLRQVRHDVAGFLRDIAPLGTEAGLLERLARRG